MEEAVKTHVPIEEESDSGSQYSYYQRHFHGIQTSIARLYITIYHNYLNLIDANDGSSEYIAEDRDTEESQTHKSAQWVQQEILENLHNVVGGSGTIPEEATKGLILQVKFPLKFYAYYQC